MLNDGEGVTTTGPCAQLCATLAGRWVEDVELAWRLMAEVAAVVWLTHVVVLTVSSSWRGVMSSLLNRQLS